MMRGLIAMLGIAACGDNVSRAPAVDAAGDAAQPVDAPPLDAPAVARRLCVVNSDDTVAIFDALQDGDGPPLRRFGRVTTLSSPGWAAIDPVHDELFITDAGTQEIAVFKRTANGGVEPLRRITHAAAGVIAIDTVHDELVVTSGSSIYVYPRTASGDTTPLRTLDTGYAFLYPHAVAIDLDHDELVVTGGSAIAVYPRTATGAPLPTRQIVGAATGLANPFGVVVDTVHDEIIAATGTSSVAVFSRTATGNVAPLRTISGSSTQLGTTWGLALVGDEVLVSDLSTLWAFPRAANGDIAPLRTLDNAKLLLGADPVHDEIVTRGDGITTFARTASGSDAPLRAISDNAAGLYQARGIASDLVHEEVWVGSSYAISAVGFHMTGEDGAAIATLTPVVQAGSLAVDPLHGEVVVASYDLASQIASTRVFDRSASAGAPPLRTLTPAQVGAFTNWNGGVAVDTVHDELVATNLGAAPAITTFARTANGNTAPARTIAIPGDSLYGVAVDPAHDEIYVVDGGGTNPRQIGVYARTATGTATPLRAIEIPNATAGSQPYPIGIAIDVPNDEIYVADFGRDAIFVYPRTAAGAAAPTRTIAGPSTALYRPTGVALCH